jgi:DNA-directed RNA polymerase subunit N (RpoN/RPB10)
MSERGTWEQFNRRVNDLVFVESVGTPVAEAVEQALEELGVEHECQLQMEELIDHDPWICFKCKQPVPHQFPEENHVAYALNDNGLTLSFEGGYGEFIDHIGTQATMVLCHECAHALAEFLGLDVRNWHTHNPATGQHEDHHTWGRHEPD